MFIIVWSKISTDGSPETVLLLSMAGLLGMIVVSLPKWFLKHTFLKCIHIYIFLITITLNTNLLKDSFWLIPLLFKELFNEEHLADPNLAWSLVVLLRLLARVRSSSAEKKTSDGLSLVIDIVREYGCFEPDWCKECTESALPTIL